MKNLTLPIRFGIVTSAVLIAYFLILALMGKHTNVFYSLFNGIITGFGIYETIKYTKIKQGKSFSYGNGFTAGITTGFIATLLFTIFFAFYATELDSAFLDKLSVAWSNDYKNFQGIVFNSRNSGNNLCKSPYHFPFSENIRAIPTNFR